MKKNWIVLISMLFFTFVMNAQLSVTGDANYELNVVAYMDRPDNGCGDDGIRSVYAELEEGADEILYEGRKKFAKVDDTLSYTKNNKVTRAEINIKNRWEIGFAFATRCNDGETRLRGADVTSTDFNYYKYDLNHGLWALTINSRPVVSINTPKETDGTPIPLNLASTDLLKITLPDNLETQHYNWKYRIGSGAAQDIPNSFNNTNELFLKGNEFLPDSAIEQTVSVWLEMGSNLGEELVRGIAVRNTYLHQLNICRGLNTCHEDDDEDDDDDDEDDEDDDSGDKILSRVNSSNLSSKNSSNSLASSFILNDKNCNNISKFDDRRLCLGALENDIEGLFDLPIDESSLINYSSPDYKKDDPEFIAAINKLLSDSDNLPRLTGLCEATSEDDGDGDEDEDPCGRRVNEKDEALAFRIEKRKAAIIKFSNEPYAYARLKNFSSTCDALPRISGICVQTTEDGGDGDEQVDDCGRTRRETDEEFQKRINECYTFPDIPTDLTFTEQYYVNIVRLLNETNPDGTSKYQSKASNVLTFTYKPASLFIASVQTTAPSCNNSNDAVVKVIFERDLEVGEEINNIQLNEGNTVAYDIPEGLLPITDLTEESDGSGWSYTLPESLNIPAGNYTLDIIASANGSALVTDEESVEVDIDANPIVEFEEELTVTPVVFCYGGNNGTITVTGKGGVGSFEYSFDNIDNSGDELPNENNWQPFSSPSNTEHIIAGLTAGNYEVKIRDTKGCEAKVLFTDFITREVSLTEESVIKTIEVLQPEPLLSFSFSESNITASTPEGQVGLKINPSLCIGGNDATITLTSSGGEGVFEYSFNNTDNSGNELPNENEWISFSSPLDGGQIITGLTAGNYEIKIRDAHECVILEEFIDPLTGFPELKAPELIKVIEIVEPEPQLSFSFADSDITTSTPDGQVGLELASPFCIAGKDGTITLTSSGGEGVFEYAFDNTDNAGDELFNENVWMSFTTPLDGERIITDLVAGNYEIRIRDAHECALINQLTGEVLSSVPELKKVVEILEPEPQLSFSFAERTITTFTSDGQVGLELTPPFCIAGKDGTITLTSSGGAGIFEYSFNNTDNTGDVLPNENVWMPFSSSIDTEQIITDLVAGNYEIKIRDTHECAFINPLTGEVLLNAPETIKIIELLDPEPQLSFSFAENDIIASTPDGQIGLELTPSLCIAGKDATITLTSSGGEGVFEYSFNNIDNSGNELPNENEWKSFTSPTDTEAIITDLVAGNYEVKIRDTHECAFINPLTGEVLLSAPETIKIIEILEPEPQLSFSFAENEIEASTPDGQVGMQFNPSLCIGGNDATINLTSSGGEGVFEYLFDNIDNSGDELPNENEWMSFTSPTDTEAIITDLVAGNYEIKIRDTHECAFINPLTGDVLLNAPIRKKAIEILEPEAQLSFSFSENDIVPSTPDGQVKLEFTPVFCVGGNDGAIILISSGGEGSFEYSFDNVDNSGDELPNENEWQPFTPSLNTEQIVTDLIAGNYEIKIRDTHECALTEEFVDPITGTTLLRAPVTSKAITVLEPVKPLIFNYVEENIIEPTANGFANGQIQIDIEGGTPFDSVTNSLYTVTWKNEIGSTLTDVRSEVINNGGTQVLRATLFNIPAGTYFVEITDANHSAANYKDTCYEEGTRSLGQPDPLEIILRIEKDISCHIENEYGDGIDFVEPFGILDQFQDGSIVAEVKGGVPFDGTNSGVTDCREGSLPYCFHWKKRINGVWVAIDVNDNTIINQSFGDYALNVTDKNGISSGNYTLIKNVEGENEYLLSQENDKEIYLPQPDRLTVTFNKTSATCSQGNNAEAQAFVEGGTSPYTYAWSTGETTSKIENISAGFYLVSILDAKGCRVDGKVTVGQFSDIEVEVITEKSPTCFEGNDGVIEVNVTGGLSPYKLSWNTGAVSEKLTNLSKGTYSLSIKDSQGCQSFVDFTLIDPEEISIDLGEDRTLCEDQSLLLDISVEEAGATYLWTSNNGFTSTQPSVEITEQGIYTARVTSNLNCVVEGVVEVFVSDALIDADFLITTQAYVGEEVILVNVSEPHGENNEWTIPDNVKVLEETDEKITMIFPKEGSYEIYLRSYQGDCYQDYSKTIIVQPALDIPILIDEGKQFIEEFICYPNPSNGEFKIKVALSENSNITLKLLDLATGKVLGETSEFNNQDFIVDFNMQSLAKGLYFMLLETPRGSEIRKVIIE